MVFYFSGTGNSQLAAKQIAESLGDELVSINRCLKTGSRDSFKSAKPLVFVTPTYAWRIPRAVSRWIRETNLEGSGAYFVLTCAGSAGNAASYAEKLCAQKGLRFYGLAPVLMPENYVALFPTPDKPECAAIVEKAHKRLAELAADIQKGESFAAAPVSFKDRLNSGPVNALYYRFLVRDRGFTVSCGCVSCGKCAIRCPLNNIELHNGKPVWKGNCTHCMACIGGCPAEAIEYKSASKGKRRYYIMEE